MDAPLLLHADELVVAVKPAGIPTQPDRSGDESLADWVTARTGSGVHAVHRIDRPASGLVVFAAYSRAAADLSVQFTGGAVERRYWAIVGRPALPGGLSIGGSPVTLTHRLLHDRARNRTRVDPSGRHSTLRCAVRSVGERWVLLEIELVSGRHHQIRAQLAAAGMHVGGDLKYGAQRSQHGGGIALHAVWLALCHTATGRRTEFSAPAPAGRLWTELTAGADLDTR